MTSIIPALSSALSDVEFARKVNKDSFRTWTNRLPLYTRAMHIESGRKDTTDAPPPNPLALLDEPGGEDSYMFSVPNSTPATLGSSQQSSGTVIESYKFSEQIALFSPECELIFQQQQRHGKGAVGRTSAKDPVLSNSALRPGLSKEEFQHWVETFTVPFERTKKGFESEAESRRHIKLFDKPTKSQSEFEQTLCQKGPPTPLTFPQSVILSSPPQVANKTIFDELLQRTPSPNGSNALMKNWMVGTSEVPLVGLSVDPKVLRQAPEPMISEENHNPIDRLYKQRNFGSYFFPRQTTEKERVLNNKDVQELQWVSWETV